MRTAISVIALGMLAACGQGGGGGGGNEAVPGSPVSGATSIALQPGEWESQVQATKASPSAPGARLAAIRFCITPEQAANPTASALSGDKSGADCSSKDYSISGGRIHGTMVCKIGKSGTVHMTTDGQYTPTSYDMKIVSQIDVAGRSVNSETHVTARRVGECPAKDAKSAG